MDLHGRWDDLPQVRKPEATTFVFDRRSCLVKTNTSRSERCDPLGISGLLLNAAHARQSHAGVRNSRG